jgi:hypothetical protein
MPAKVYFKDGILRMDFLGHFTTEDLMGALAEVEKLEREVRPTPHRIADLGGITTSDNRFLQVLALTQRRKAVRFANTFKSAIIAPRPADVGMARSFQMLNDHPQITIEVFPDLAAAKAWIAQDAKPTQS